MPAAATAALACKNPRRVHHGRSMCGSFITIPLSSDTRHPGEGRDLCLNRRELLKRSHDLNNVTGSAAERWAPASVGETSEFGHGVPPFGSFLDCRRRAVIAPP